MEDEVLEEKVNKWIDSHPTFEIIRVHFAHACGSEWTSFGCCIEYKRQVESTGPAW
jgi:hypothetical protein